MIKILIRRFVFLLTIHKTHPILDYSLIDTVIFVAHPDDELIFFGGFLLRNKNVLVVCLTNGGNRIRRREFFYSMKLLDTPYRMYDFIDGVDCKWNEKRVLKKVNSILKKRTEWKKILTHNVEGEYGHYQHKQLNCIISKSIAKNFILTHSISSKQLKSGKYLLQNELINRKKTLAQECYKSQHWIIEQLHIYFTNEKV